MQSKDQTLFHMDLYREFRHIESRGLSINYAEMEHQLIAIAQAEKHEQLLRQHCSGTFLKLLSHV